MTTSRCLPIFKQSVGLPALLLVVLGSVPPTVLSAELPNKPLPPSDELQAQAIKVVEEVYRSEYAAARSPSQKSALADKLIRTAPSLANDLVGRYVILRVARDIAASAGDFPLVRKALEESERTFAVDLLDDLSKALERCVPNVRSSEDNKRIAREVVPLIDQAFVASRFEVAKSLSRSAIEAARRSRDNELIKAITARGLEIEDAEKEFAAIAPALAVLDGNPQDPDANLAVGRFRCFVLGDWQVGLPQLARGSKGAVQALAASDFARPQTAAAQTELGDGWWALAIEETGLARRNLQQRAAHWYRTAFATVTGLTKIRLEKRLAEVGASAPTASLPAGAVLVLSFDKKSAIKQAGKSLVKDLSGNNLHGELHGPTPGPGKAGEALLFDGIDDFVLVPGLRNRLTQDLTGLTVAAWIRPARESFNEKLVFDVGTIARESVKLALLRGARFMLPGRAGGKVLIAPLQYDGQWHHLVGTYDGAQQVLYIDGQLVASAAVTGLVLSAQAIAPEEARIGSQSKSGPDQGKRYFEGSIDEVAVFSRGLNEQEVAALYQLGLSSKPLSE
jgi:hypothetical protein